MLTLQIPTLLALLGTALMAVVIFAPERAFSPPAISCAPPFAPAPERWYPRFEESPDPPAPGPHPPPQPDWPALVDPRASGCDAGARIGLVDALAAVRAPWARTILRRALDDEPEPAVREAVAAALSQPAGLA